MFGFDYLLAAALLTAPLDTPETAASAEQFAGLRSTMQQLAIHWEVMDAREIRYVLSRGEDYAADMKLLRRRNGDLLDAPPLHDCLRFPARSHVSDLLSFNRSYRQYLDQRQLLEASRWWEYHEVITEVDRLYQIWDTIRDSRCEYYYVTVRRQALKRLRELLGQDDYYTGQLPPYVPVWRFRVMK